MYDFLTILNDIIAIFGHLLRAAGFGLFGFGISKFTQNAYAKADWPMQMALALGLFGLLIALTVFSSAGSAGAFALGAGIAFLAMKKEEAPEADATLVEEPKKKK